MSDKSARRAKPALASQVFARRVREVRRRRNWSQADLAARLGVDRTTVAKIEREGGTRSNVSLTELFDIAAALGVTPVQLLVPRDSEAGVVVGGKVIPPKAAREWIRGERLLDRKGDHLTFFLELPEDEQRELLTRAFGGRTPLTALIASEKVDAVLEAIAAWEATQKERNRKEEGDG
jgi:transcriptional regulator with XRE-family HTH domain